MLTMTNSCSYRSTSPKGFALFILLLCSGIAIAQTNISGIVNTYHPVIEIIPAKACIRVSSIAGINVNTRIMLVQMKGATINTSNSASFGDTTTTNEAGMYEIGTICYLRGDSIFLFHDLINTYNTTTGKVQVVQFAEYLSATVVDTLKAAPWNNSTGTGGVIALFADQDITLNAPIYADSSGFRGGQFVLSNGTCFNGINNYSYPGASTSPQFGAYKGEGVTDIGTAQNGGRGVLANGGGGGNNHNNSGGGGANLSAGGIGGGNSSTAGGCTSSAPGVGGKPLKNWNGQKIFFGGGGGAGHNNNGLFTRGGGHGGGIIFIWTPTIYGNGQLITANGGEGGESQSDGAGGGGAGGTIIMQVDNYTGSLTVRANGGNGGNSNDAGNVGRCFGGGGGGSGGAVYFAGAVPAITSSTSAGLAGVESGRDAGCGPVQAAANGSTGLLFSSYTFIRSTATAGYCAMLLPSRLIYFKGQLIQDKIKLSWQLQHPELVKYFTIEKKNSNQEWVTVATINAMNNRETYYAMDSLVWPGNNYYRLKITEHTSLVYYSEIRHIYYDITDNAFTIYPNPAISRVTIFRQSAATNTLQLLDMNGKLLLQQTIRNRQEEIRLPELSAGIYLIRIDATIKKLFVR